MTPPQFACQDRAGAAAPGIVEGSVKLLDRLDELDYRLHLRRRPDAPRPELTVRRLWLIRAIWFLIVLYTSAVVAVAIAGGPWWPLLPPLAVAALSGVSYDRETRRRIFPWLPKRRREP